MRALRRHVRQECHSNGIGGPIYMAIHVMFERTENDGCLITARSNLCPGRTIFIIVTRNQPIWKEDYHEAVDHSTKIVQRHGVPPFEWTGPAHMTVEFQPQLRQHAEETLS
mgnify:CR=1 FL=1